MAFEQEETFHIDEDGSIVGGAGRLEDAHNVKCVVFIARAAEIVYEDGIWVGYRYYNTKKMKVAYPFGYGLSYTNFDYSDLKLSSAEFEGKLTASVAVTNKGKVAGAFLEGHLAHCLVGHPPRSIKTLTCAAELSASASRS